ncbi:MAG: asparagine synthase (glutamine-hydrolyzing) [Bacteroidales bacterium]
MCGINGLISFSHSDLRPHLTRMNQALAHRGPDDDGSFVQDGVFLGHRRLSIIDLSKAGHQPMISANKNLVLVYNGEVYNFRELRARLGNYPYRSSTDTEVVLAAWQEWGPDCINQLNGMFAFAVYDIAAGKIWLVRDRFGIKPLYYASAPDTFLFSSELRALLASGLVPARLNPGSLADYLRYQTVHAPGTILQDVLMLLPGTTLEISLKEKNIPAPRACWKFSSQSPTAGREARSSVQVKKELAALLAEAVEKRMQADVDFGAFLSGGIDSSSIVALMSQASTRRVNTFSLIFEEKEFNEAQFSRVIAKRYNTLHHEIHVSPEQFLHWIPDALAAMDHPSGDGPNSWVVSKKTREEGISMALSGLGGDELFGGYNVFSRMKYLQQMQATGLFPQPLRRVLGHSLSLLPFSVRTRKAREIMSLDKWDFSSVYPLLRKLFPENIISELLCGSELPPNRVTEICAAVSSRITPGNSHPWLISAISRAELSTYLPNILLRDTDYMSMAHSLEVRVPFLDFRLVDYVLGLPDPFKQIHPPKKLLVDTMGSLLPVEVTRRKKMGFTFPWQEWMKNELRTYCADRLGKLSKLEYFNEEVLTDLWKRFLLNDPAVSWSRLWPLVVLSEWMVNNHVDE